MMTMAVNNDIGGDDTATHTVNSDDGDGDGDGSSSDGHGGSSHDDEIAGCLQASSVRAAKKKSAPGGRGRRIPTTPKEKEYEVLRTYSFYTDRST